MKGQFPERQLEMLEIIWNSGPLTANEMERYTHAPLSSITGRINELMHKQAIRVASVEIVNGRHRNQYKVRFESDPLNTFSRGLQDRVDLFIGELHDHADSLEDIPKLESTAEMGRKLRRVLDEMVKEYKLSES